MKRALLAILALDVLIVVGMLTAMVEAQSAKERREEKILELVKRVPASIEDRETVHERSARRKIIAKAIVEVSAEPGTRGWFPERAAIVAIYTVWWFESRFGQTVHEGGLSRWGSDDGRAKCLGQLHVSKRLPPEDWAATAGTDLEATKRCARATLRAFRGAAGACGWGTRGGQHAWLAAFRGYRGNCTESFPTENARVAKAVSIMRQL